MRAARGALDVVTCLGGEMRETGCAETVVARQELGLVAALVVRLEADVARQHVGVLSHRQTLVAR